MDRLLYWLALALVRLLQSPPLPWVARIGRAGGALAFLLDGRHRRVALENLRRAFPEKTEPELRAIAREHFRRLGENYSCSIKTAAMPWAQLRNHCHFDGAEKLFPPGRPLPRNLVAAIGHFGNFELYARFGQFFPEYQCATTYRGLRQASLDRLLQSLRRQSGCLFFERRTEAAALKALMNGRGIMLGLLADQHAGDGGLWLPFFGRLCSTSAAPAIFALRYDAPLLTGFCFRLGLAQWRIEPGPIILTRVQGKARPAADITRDLNRAFEDAVRRDPANWFWVHNRWKTPPAARSANLAGAAAHSSSAAAL